MDRDFPGALCNCAPPCHTDCNDYWVANNVSGKLKFTLSGFVAGACDMIPGPGFTSLGGAVITGVNGTFDITFGTPVGCTFSSQIQVGTFSAIKYLSSTNCSSGPTTPISGVILLDIICANSSGGFSAILSASPTPVTQSVQLDAVGTSLVLSYTSGVSFVLDATGATITVSP